MDDLEDRLKVLFESAAPPALLDAIDRIRHFQQAKADGLIQDFSWRVTVKDDVATIDLDIVPVKPIECIRFTFNRDGDRARELVRKVDWNAIIGVPEPKP